MADQGNGVANANSSGYSPNREERTQAIARAVDLVNKEQWDILDAERLDRHLRDLGLYGPYIRRALLDALAEITWREYNGDFPAELAYEDGIKDAPLWSFCWQSRSRGCRMYMKFVFHEGRLVLVSFHKSNRERAKQ